MNKIAVTTVSNDERYTKHLSLVRDAWHRLGYKFYVVCVGTEEFTTEFADQAYFVKLPKEMYESPFKATYIQSLRFWAASNLIKGSKCTLITDADILPIDKSHFEFELDEGKIMHLNATPYKRFDKGQFPACYYAMSYRTWHRYFPRCEDPIKWLDLYLQGKKEIGRDEYWAAHFIEKSNTIKFKLINCLYGGQRYGRQYEGKIYPNMKIIDFHFPYIKDVKEIYDKLVEISDGKK